MEFAIAHYNLHISRRYALRRAPTRGAPIRFRQPHVGLFQFDAIALPRRGTENTLTLFIIHEGPRRAGQTHLNSDPKIADEGRPQGGEGTHKGCPYLHFSAKKPASSRKRGMEFAIAHYDLHSSRRYALRRAPTRGAPTRFRQPHVGLSQFDAISLEIGGVPGFWVDVV